MQINIFLIFFCAALVRSTAQQLFIKVHSLIESPEEETRKMLESGDGLLRFINDYLVDKFNKGTEAEESATGRMGLGEVYAMAKAVYKETTSKI